MPKPEPLEYWNNGTQSGTGMLPYWTEIQDAGMPMPAALTSSPMPSYAHWSKWYQVRDVIFMACSIGKLSSCKHHFFVTWLTTYIL